MGPLESNRKLTSDLVVISVFIVGSILDERLISERGAVQVGLLKAISHFSPAEIDEESVGFREGLGVTLAAIKEAVARTVIADQFARPACLLHHTLERNDGSVGNRGVLLAM